MSKIGDSGVCGRSDCDQGVVYTDVGWGHYTVGLEGPAWDHFAKEPEGPREPVAGAWGWKDGRPLHIPSYLRGKAERDG